MKEADLQELVELISLESFGLPFLHQARFNPRLRTTGGRYLLRSHDIEINPKQYDEHGKDELISIIKHELCHYHLHIQKRGYQHKDKDFRELLQRVGGARFCKPLASNSTKKAKTKIHVFQCMSCQLIYKRKRDMNVSKYACGKCRGKLRKLKTIIDP